MAKFYHYTVWVNNESGTKLSLDSCLADEVFSQSNYVITEDEEKSYHTRFNFLGADEYHGALVRARDDSSYVRLDETESLSRLSEMFEEEGETGSRQRDLIDFGVKQKSNKMDLLVEVGFQTPGIGMFTRYIRQHLDTDEDTEPTVEYETKTSGYDDEKLEDLMDSTLVEAEVSYKRNPKTYEELEATEGIQSTIPDNYKLKYNMKLRSKNGDKSGVVDVLADHLGLNTDTPVESITKLDLPGMLYKLEVTGKKGDREINENLTDLVMKEEINKAFYQVFDDSLGEKLIERIEDA